MKVLAPTELAKPSEDDSALPQRLGIDIPPEILAAVSEVDVTLLDWALGLSPRERLRAASRASNAIARFVNASSPSR